MTRRATTSLTNCYTPLVVRRSIHQKSNDEINDRKPRQGAKHDDKGGGVGLRKRSNGAGSDRADNAFRRILLETSVLSSSSSSSSSSLCYSSASSTMTSGSALVEMGHTKILAEVVGPLTAQEGGGGGGGGGAPPPPASVDHGILHCQVQFVPHFGRSMRLAHSNAVISLDDYAAASSAASSKQRNQQSVTEESGGSSDDMGRGSGIIIGSGGSVSRWASQQQRSLEIDLESKLKSALTPAVPLEKFPKCILTVRVTILQDDGGLLSTSLMAASLALADAAVELYDLVTSCTVAVYCDDDDDIDKDECEENKDERRITKTKSDQKNNNQEVSHGSKQNGWSLLVDPDEAEEAEADAIMTMAFMMNWKEVTLWQQTGGVCCPNPTTMDLCREGCRQLHAMMRQCLLDKVLEQQNKQKQQQKQQQGWKQ